EYINIELDTKCSCLQSKLNSHLASIQFSRRYLQCQSSMPIAILRSFIQQILPHSSMTQVSFYDSNDRLLQDSDLISSLKSTTSATTTTLHIPIRFTLFNKITSFGHCSCSSLIEDKNELFSFNPKIIKHETIDKTLSTCSIISTRSISPCLSSTSSSLNELSNSISIVNLLTPPSSSNSSFLIENIVHTTNDMTNQTIIDEITSKFGEICPPLPKKGRNRISKKVISPSYSSNLPLDLSLKKRPSSFDFFSSQTKWIK
ncbi:unnamed protein product, partial [Rotaria sp. Silwood1]